MTMPYRTPSASTVPVTTAAFPAAAPTFPAAAPAFSNAPMRASYSML